MASGALDGDPSALAEDPASGIVLPASATGSGVAYASVIEVDPEDARAFDEAGVVDCPEEHWLDASARTSVAIERAIARQMNGIARC